MFSQTITLAATDSNASGFTEALSGETIVVTGTVLSAAQLAQPVINTPTPIDLPDAHVTTGGTPDDETTLSISNDGNAVLSASVLSTSGQSYANGSISQLAAGATDTTDITVGVNNTSAGAKTGVVTLAETSGAGVALMPQSFGVSGVVFNEAAASVTAPSNIYLHAGDGGGQEKVALNVANTAPAIPDSERLDATVLGVVNGAAAMASGSVSELSAGSSDNSSLKVKVSTATAATINATVAVQVTSDGTGVDTLGTTSLGTVDVPVTITVDNYATAAFGQVGGSGSGSLVQAGSIFTLDLGTAVTYQALTADLGLFNTAEGPADWITGSLTAGGDAAFSNSGTGVFGAIGAGGDAGLDISLSTGTAGVYTETVVFNGTDGNPSGYAQAMNTETLVVTGTVVALPSGTIASNPIDFGNVRLGSTQIQGVSVTNTAPAGSAFLDAFGGGAIGAASESGGVLLLAPGATNDTGLMARLNTGTVGVQTGTVYANYQADPGTGAELYLGGAAVTVQGTVFQGATASLTGPATVSPDALTASVNVQQSTGGNDTLIGSANFGDTFLGTSAGLAGDLIKGFGGSDAIDITDISAASVHPLSFNTAAGQLTVADGTHSVTLTFTGSYTAGSFATPVNDGHGGTLIKFG